MNPNVNEKLEALRSRLEEMLKKAPPVEPCSNEKCKGGVGKNRGGRVKDARYSDDGKKLCIKCSEEWKAKNPDAKRCDDCMEFYTATRSACPRCGGTKLAEGADFTPEEQKERELIQKNASVRFHKQNPFISGSPGNRFVICFKTLNRDSEPLFWTGSGFKNMAVVRSEPQYFETKAEAEKKIRSEILDFIRKWRMDQTHLIIGW